VSPLAVAVVLGLLLVLLIRTRAVRAGGAVVAVVFGLVLGSTTAGPVVNQALTSSGTWMWAQVQSW
jgi:membrane-associated PAP2 superfamily phosphatase